MISPLLRKVFSAVDLSVIFLNELHSQLISHLFYSSWGDLVFDM